MKLDLYKKIGVVGMISGIFLFLTTFALMYFNLSSLFILLTRIFCILSAGVFLVGAIFYLIYFFKKDSSKNV